MRPSQKFFLKALLLPLFLLMLAAVVILVARPDLGRKKSFTYCIILIALGVKNIFL